MSEFSLLDKLLGRSYVEKKEVLGLQIEFRVLTNPERAAIFRRSQSEDILVLSEMSSVPTLARSIVSIDGNKWEESKEIAELRAQKMSAPIVELIEQHLSTYPFPVISALYQAYAEVVASYQNKLEELKKNLTPVSPETSG